MKAIFKYLIYPTPGQKTRLAKLFGCICWRNTFLWSCYRKREPVVWNDSLACCQEKYTLREKKPINSDLQKLFITQAKKTEYREWLSEVSAIPLQQSLNDLNQAYQNFFQSTKGQRKGRPIKPPKFIH
ncbi:MAG: helix-turn-helix domain-containing protein [Okeania sp. SIO3B5]|uniref:helix-turn-helix domain-containing protein n=1 Tax=Okeania sp. SIO3B5 TaxID=2607811 RepID=UPI0013FEE1F8|nr:helix-turn-helix domain-containing protein [Okeania sp. SIO3B5]NEO58187.1 helix-turn-helix domain-containing protein [Okeania sp. SIO3B5]